MATHLQHLHSKETYPQQLLDRTVRYPNEPSANSLLEGEIAVNYATGLETLFIKNYNNEIVSFETAKVTKNLVSITYDELVSLKAERKLVPGQMYRITDYLTQAYVENRFKSNEKAFDIIVIATDIDKLSEDAKAIKHPIVGNETDYFEHANMEAWELKYCLENDTNRFGWASNSHTGVIYYMKDEWGNECPYDFKNIQFYRSINGTDQPCFTFTWAHIIKNNNTVVGIDIFDASLIGHTLSNSDGEIIGTVNNVIPPLFVGGKQELNYITFVSTTDYDDAYYGTRDNVFGKSCYNITFLNNCSYNSFGNNCSDITFGTDAQSNSLGNGINNITVAVGLPMIIEESNQYINIEPSNDFGNGPKAITIKQGYHHGYSTNVKTITIDNTHTNKVLVFKSSDTTEITS